MVRAVRSAVLTLTLLAYPGVVVLAEAPAAPSTDAAVAVDARRQQLVVEAEGIGVSLGEVEDALAQQGPFGRIRYRHPDDLRTLVGGMVRAKLLAAEAKRRGYDEKPAVRQTVKESAAQALVRLEIEDKVTPQSIPLEDVRAYYEAHPADFHRVAARRASKIVLESADQAKQLLPQAQKADARGFAELAKQHSKDPETKQQGGDLGYFGAEPASDGTETNVDPALRKAAFALKQVGDTSEPVEVGSQFVIVRLTGERAERHSSLDDAAPSIRAKLWRERRQQALDALVAKLRAQAKPQVFAERIQAISFDDMEKRPSGFAPDPPAPSSDAATPARP